MRKLLIGALIAIVILPTLALAEANDFVTYTDATDGYQISFPGSFVIVNSDTYADVAARIESGEIDEASATIITRAQKVILSGGIELFIAPGNEINIAISINELSGTYPAQVLIDELCPRLIETYSAMLGDFEVLDPGYTYESGEYTYGVLAVSGTVEDAGKILFCLMLSANEKLYLVEFTMPDTADLEAMSTLTDKILASFVPGE